MERNKQSTNSNEVNRQQNFNPYQQGNSEYYRQGYEANPYQQSQHYANRPETSQYNSYQQPYYPHDANFNRNPNAYTRPQYGAPTDNKIRKLKSIIYLLSAVIAILSIGLVYTIVKLNAKDRSTAQTNKLIQREQRQEKTVNQTTQVKPPTVKETEKKVTKRTQAEKINLADNVKQEIQMYVTSFGSYTFSYGISIITNNNPVSVAVQGTAIFLHEGEKVGADNEDIQVIPPKGEAVLIFNNDTHADDCEVTLKISEPRYYREATSFIEADVTDVGEKLVVTATNTGNYPSEFLQGIALFYYQGELVNSDSKYFVDDASKLMPDDSISKELSCHDDYDEYKIYWIGRANK